MNNPEFWNLPIGSAPKAPKYPNSYTLLDSFICMILSCTYFGFLTTRFLCKLILHRSFLDICPLSGGIAPPILKMIIFQPIVLIRYNKFSWELIKPIIEFLDTTTDTIYVHAVILYLPFEEAYLKKTSYTLLYY